MDRRDDTAALLGGGSRELTADDPEEELANTAERIGEVSPTARDAAGESIDGLARGAQLANEQEGYGHERQ